MEFSAQTLNPETVLTSESESVIVFLDSDPAEEEITDEEAEEEGTEAAEEPEETAGEE